jgi:steroid delta-isomerase-like uncharacterized protein
MSETESATAAEGTKAPAETSSEATPSIEWIRDFAQRWIDACNSHEVDRLLALMSEDIEYRDDAWPKPMRGHADVREFLERGWRAFPDITFELLGGPYVIPGEPRAALHWRGRATHTGPLDPPGFAPTGRRWEQDGVDFHEYRDGRVCKLRITCDMLSVSRQLGLMPAAGGRAERAMAMAQRSASGVASRVQQAIRRSGKPPPSGSRWP